jgi:YgiT-type zinc finger domain-containing protein
MNCVICKHSKTKKGFTTVVLNRGISTIIIKYVPAQICENCGEYYLSSEMTKKIFKIANESIKNGIEIEIIKYVA